MRVYAVRGAVSVEEDRPEEIVRETVKMVEKVLSENRIPVRRIISIQFSITRDLQSINPAAALRRGNSEIPGVPLFVAQEPDSLDAMEKVIRILLYFRGPLIQKIKPQYLGRAKGLRPDITAS